MTLQDVANAITEAEALALALPDSPERHAVIARIQKAYALLVDCSDELMSSLDEIAEYGRAIHIALTRQ